MTTLMIKTHKITGLKYFCKTQKTGDAFNNYHGSGKYWVNHIKKHGKDITTEIIGVYEDDDPELIYDALTYSDENNIVESDDYANLIPENGIDGRPLGAKHSDETKLKISLSNKGNKSNLGGTNSNAGKTYNEIYGDKEVLCGFASGDNNPAKLEKNRKIYSEKMIKNNPAHTLKTCPHCNRDIGLNNFNRWHGDNCKKRVT